MAVYKSAKFDGDTIDFIKPIWERPVDWSTVKVDTPVLVSSSGDEWMKRHFACFKDGYVEAFNDGKTSWSSDGATSTWKYARLA